MNLYVVCPFSIVANCNTTDLWECIMQKSIYTMYRYHLRVYPLMFELQLPSTGDFAAFCLIWMNSYRAVCPISLLPWQVPRWTLLLGGVACEVLEVFEGRKQHVEVFLVLLKSSWLAFKIPWKRIHLAVSWCGAVPQRSTLSVHMLQESRQKPSRAACLSVWAASHINQAFIPYWIHIVVLEKKCNHSLIITVAIVATRLLFTPDPSLVWKLLVVTMPRTQSAPVAICCCSYYMEARASFDPKRWC